MGGEIASLFEGVRSQQELTGKIADRGMDPGKLMPLLRSLVTTFARGLLQQGVPITEIVKLNQDLLVLVPVSPLYQAPYQSAGGYFSTQPWTAGNFTVDPDRMPGLTNANQNVNEVSDFTSGRVAQQTLAAYDSTTFGIGDPGGAFIQTRCDLVGILQGYLSTALTIVVTATLNDLLYMASGSYLNPSSTASCSVRNFLAVELYSDPLSIGFATALRRSYGSTYPPSSTGQPEFSLIQNSANGNFQTSQNGGTFTVGVHWDNLPVDTALWVMAGSVTQHLDIAAGANLTVQSTSDWTITSIQVFPY